MKKFSLYSLIALTLALVAWTSAGDVKITGILQSKVQQFYGATGTNFLKVPDNLASALVVEDTLNGGDLLTLTTTDSGEKLAVNARYSALTSLNAGVTAAVGSAQGDGPITVTATQVTTAASAGDAVTLPTAVAGMLQIVCNHAAANAADAFPATGAQINGASANAAISLAAGECMFCIAFSATRWGCVIGSAT